MSEGDIHPMVIVSDYRIPDPTRVWHLLEHNQAALAAIGAHHVVVYLATNDDRQDDTFEDGRVLVMIGVHSREPVVELLRSRVFFDWFDEAGVEDIPAVFAGEIVGRFATAAAPVSEQPGVVMAAFASVADVPKLTEEVGLATDRFTAAGIRKTWVFQAFDDSREVLILQEFAHEESARQWIDHPDASAQWMRGGVGVGAYPPLFVGRYLDMMRIEAD